MKEKNDYYYYFFQYLSSQKNKTMSDYAKDRYS